MLRGSQNDRVSVSAFDPFHQIPMLKKTFSSKVGCLPTSTRLIVQPVLFFFQEFFTHPEFYSNLVPVPIMSWELPLQCWNAVIFWKCWESSGSAALSPVAADKMFQQGSSFLPNSVAIKCLVTPLLYLHIVFHLISSFFSSCSMPLDHFVNPVFFHTCVYLWTYF